jgi:hypothetical protein
MKKLFFLIASFLILTATSTDATSADAASTNTKYVGVFSVHFTLRQTQGEDRFNSHAEPVEESTTKFASVLANNAFIQKHVPKGLQDKPQKVFQKHSQKYSNNSPKHISDKNYRKVVRSEKMVTVVQQNPQQNIAQQTALSPFSRTRLTVVKQRNVKMFQKLPNGYSSTVFGGQNFYHYGGRYYGYSGNMYTIIGAPIGIRTRLLPVGNKRIFIGGVPHFYYSGVYYRDIGNSEYEVIDPTIGTIVPELPDDNVEEVMIDGQTFYEYNNILYKSVVTKNGVQYEVVGKLGA